jgi:hypothetical protein
LSLCALACLPTLPAVAQDKSRVDEILFHAEQRADHESNASYEDGDYPRSIQLLKMRYEIRPWDGELATDLIWMLGNIEDYGGALLFSKRYKLDNPKDPDHGLPEATLYWTWRCFEKIPSVLEEDIKKDWTMHRNVFVILAGAYDRMGFYKDAARVLDVALKHFPGDEVFLRNKKKAESFLKG